VRARDLGIAVGTGTPGPLNAITDVAGVRVGMTTVIEGEAVCTGVTVAVPPALPLFAGCHRLNGNGELTGLEYVRENGMLTTPVAITNTHSVGVVRDALVAAQPRGLLDDAWSLPVVGETWDGWLNDINGFHVRAEHVFAALEGASGGPVPEGNVGGGTAMICHGFKGGTGTASRVVPSEDGGFTVGVLVQANHGARARLSVEGVPVGRLVPHEVVPEAYRAEHPGGTGSIIGIVATDAPLLPGQCDRLAQRAGLGVARVGGAGEDSSGDLFFCFAAGNRPGEAAPGLTLPLTMLRQERINPLFYAVIEATEEAILNALVAAETMTGRHGRTAHALPHDLLVQALAPRAA
jgi:D-aminopeptidase